MKQRAFLIISDLVTSKDFTNCIRKIEPFNLQDDLKSEVTLILLETKAEKIISLWEEKKLTFYVVRIIINLAFSNTSPFFTKYRKHVYLPIDMLTNKCEAGRLTDRSEDDLNEKIKRERVLNLINAVNDYGDTVPGLDEYESMMLKLYTQHGTYRAMAKATLIPSKSCHHTVTKAIKKIKQNLKNEL